MDLAAYLPVALMIVFGILAAGVLLGASWFVTRKLGLHRPTPEKLAPYECGIVPLQEPAERFPVRFYLVAMLFVIFDVEIVFLFLWAVRFEQLGWAGFLAVALFMALLIETLGYVWKRGALDWNVARRERYRRVVAPEPEVTGEAA